MYKIIFALVFLLVSCETKEKVEAKTPPVPKNEKEKEKPKPVEQSFKQGMEVICNSIDKIESKDPAKISAHLDKQLTNTQLSANFKAMAKMNSLTKKSVFDKLVLQAELPTCPYQLFLQSEIQREDAEKKASAPLPFQEAYVGDHVLRVNRVNHSYTKGKANIKRIGSTMILESSVKKGRYRLAVKGTVLPVSEKEFVLKGELKGIPDMSWKNEVQRERTTKGSFLFKATKNRKFWRLYKVNGKKCACGEGCGNDFCYIDLSFSEK